MKQNIILLPDTANIFKISDFIMTLEDIKTEYGDIPIWWTDGESQETPIDREMVNIEPYHNEQYPLRLEIG